MLFFAAERRPNAPVAFLPHTWAPWPLYDEQSRATRGRGDDSSQPAAFCHPHKRGKRGKNPRPGAARDASRGGKCASTLRPRMEQVIRPGIVGAETTAEMGHARE